MPVYLCRLPNGDVSIVGACNKSDAIVVLDEFDNAEHAEISRLNELLALDESSKEYGEKFRRAAGAASAVVDDWGRRDRREDSRGDRR